MAKREGGGGFCIGKQKEGRGKGEWEIKEREMKDKGREGSIIFKDLINLIIEASL